MIYTLAAARVDGGTVEYTQEQLSGFKAEFATRRRRQIAVAVVIGLGAILLLIMPDRQAS